MGMGRSGWYGEASFSLMSKRDYYEVLGVGKDADEAELFVSE